MLLHPDRLISKNDNLKEYILDLIKCNLCQNILKNPYDCFCCNITYCYTCINQFMAKSKKCPNESIYITSEDESECKLKQTTSNLSNLISKLKFSCINKMYGCNEELESNDIELHELCCQYFDDSRGSFSIQRNSSIVSFKNKSDHFTHNEAKPIYESNVDDKLEKIMIQLNQIRSAMPETNRVSLPYRNNDFVTETPKFSLGFNSKPESDYIVRNKYSKDKINFNNNTFYSQNLSTALEHQKIFSELEILNDKIANFENKLEMICPDKINIKLDHKYVADIIPKLEHSRSRNKNLISPHTSANTKVNTMFSLQNNVTSPNSPQKEKSLIQKDTKKFLGPPPVIKKILIKQKLEPKPNSVNSPTKNILNSPKENLKILNKKELLSITQNDNKANLSHANNQIKFEDMNEMFNIIIKKLDLLMSNSNNIYEMNKDNFKEYLNSDFIKELKNCFLEITLDSYDVYIEKVQELFKKTN